MAITKIQRGRTALVVSGWTSLARSNRNAGTPDDQHCHVISVNSSTIVILIIRGILRIGIINISVIIAVIISIGIIGALN